jgi:hypothetical protein
MMTNLMTSAQAAAAAAEAVRAVLGCQVLPLPLTHLQHGECPVVAAVLKALAAAAAAAVLGHSRCTAFARGLWQSSS